MERNVLDVVRDEKGQANYALARAVNREYLTPVHQNTAAANREKNAYRRRVRDLHLSRTVAKGNGVSEAHAVQLLGEAAYAN
jgi:hypothetical protein